VNVAPTLRRVHLRKLLHKIFLSLSGIKNNNLTDVEHSKKSSLLTACHFFPGSATAE
jgi:hypothetical protein